MPPGAAPRHPRALRRRDLLGEVDRTATVLGILVGGRLLFQGTREELLARSAPDVLLDTSDPHRAAAVLARRHPVVRDGTALRVRGLDRTASAQAVAALVHAGVGVHGVRGDATSLGDVFLA